MSSINSELLTPSEVASRLRLTIGTIKWYIQTGKLKAVKVGYRTIRITQKDLDEFIEEHHGDNYFND